MKRSDLRDISKDESGSGEGRDQFNVGVKDKR